MSITMPEAALNTLWEAARRPLLNDRRYAVGKRVSRIAEEGWAYLTTVSDLIEDFDYRLRRGSIALDVEGIVEAFGYRFEDVCIRPRKRSISTVMLQALPAASFASLLCDLESMGFLTVAQQLCELLAPKLEGKATITSHELSVLWNRRTQDRSVITVRSTTNASMNYYDEGRLPTGHRYEAMLDDDRRPVSVEIKGPKYRRTPEPRMRTCEVCGTSYMHGDPDSSASHRKAHRRVTHVTSPTALPQMVAHLATTDGSGLVQAGSPAWMHREIYERAFAFKREMGYDFVQWASPKRDDDPDVRGHLMTDADGVIHGACAFRLRRNDDGDRWGLQWIWIRPDARRSGLLSERWADYRERYADFHVEGPVSKAMRQFLSRNGETHLMT